MRMKSEMRDDVSDVEEPDDDDGAADSEGLTGKPGCKSKPWSRFHPHVMLADVRVAVKVQDQRLRVYLIGTVPAGTSADVLSPAEGCPKCRACGSCGLSLAVGGARSYIQQ